MASHEEYTGILPRRFRKWSYGVLATIAAVGVFHGWVTGEEVSLYIAAATAILGLPVASVNTRGGSTVD